MESNQEPPDQIQEQKTELMDEDHQPSQILDPQNIHPSSHTHKTPPSSLSLSPQAPSANTNTSLHTHNLDPSYLKEQEMEKPCPSKRKFQDASTRFVEEHQSNQEINQEDQEAQHSCESHKKQRKETVCMVQDGSNSSSDVGIGTAVISGVKAEEEINNHKVSEGKQKVGSWTMVSATKIEQSKEGNNRPKFKCQWLLNAVVSVEKGLKALRNLALKMDEDLSSVYYHIESAEKVKTCFCHGSNSLLHALSAALTLISLLTFESASDLDAQIHDVMTDLLLPGKKHEDPEVKDLAHKCMQKLMGLQTVYFNRIFEHIN